MANSPKIEFERGLPASPDAERSVLGSILLDNEHYNEAAEHLVEEDFALDSHRRIFRLMAKMIESGRKVDIVTLPEELGKRKETEAVGGVAYLFSLTEGLPRRLSIDEYVRIVKEKSILRAIVNTGAHLVTRAADQGEDATTLLADADNYFRRIADRTITQSFAMPYDIVKDSYGSPDKFLRSESRAGTVGTGWPDYDAYTNKFKPAHLIIVAARPSMGKTAWACNVAQHATVNQGKHVAMFSLEMSREALLRRMVCSMATVDSRRFEKGDCSQQEHLRLASALSALIEAQLFIDDTAGISLPEMRAKSHRLKKTNALDLIIIDYLQLMSAGIKCENRQEEVSHISRGLKALAKTLEIPVIALAQLNRENEKRADKKPFLSDLRESGAIEQDADIVTFLHRAEYYDREDPELKGKADFIIAKQREGPIGEVRMLFSDIYTRFDCPAREAYQQTQF